ncbi:MULTISPECIES: 30S ribosomal protein S11 [unclassified Mycoplasma]|uniref:30S ribosomal protein S11 n=1 Tax=unclassified Mycoplasma TaxID=2683645 RepID=UPI000FDD2327
MATKTASKTKKTKKKRATIVTGIAHIHATHNNTIISFSDPKGAIFAWSSSGAIGYKGTKKSTPYAASLAANSASEKAKEFGLKEVIVKIKGTGPGKDAARKQIEVSGIKVMSVKDVTPIPHNGTRPPKRVIKRLSARK